MKTGNKYKSFELLGVLDENELNYLKKVTGKNKLELATTTLANRNKNSKKSNLTVNQRNHLRLLLKKQGQTMAVTGLQRQSEWVPYFYLSELLQRNVFVLFDKEFKKHYKTLRKKGFTAVCLLLKELELERMITEGVFTRQSVQKISIILEETHLLLEEHKNNFVWRTEAYKVFLRGFHPSLAVKPVKELVKPANIWQKVYALRYQLHSTADINEKIEYLRQLYRLTSKQDSRLLQRETATTCSNLATYYMIQGKFDLSLGYFNRALRLKKYFRPANYLMLQFNYVGLSLRNLQFDTAYRIMLDVDESIQGLASVSFKWKLLKSMCYVFAGKEKEIRNILPGVPEKKDSRDYIYFYAIWAIYFTRINKSDTAVQMIETARGLSRRHQGDPGLLAFVVTIKKYHLFLHRYSSSTAAVKALELVKKIDLKSLTAGNILPLIWLKNYLEKEAK